MLSTSTGFELYTRWGRTGTKGQSETKSYSSETTAIKAFEAKFKEKTANPWASVSAGTFAEKLGKYRLVVQRAGPTAGTEDPIWQYYLDKPLDGKQVGWHDYFVEASQIVESVYDEWQGNADMLVRFVKSGTYTYKVDFNLMTQTNMDHPNHTCRPVRRFDRLSGTASTAAAASTS